MEISLEISLYPLDKNYKKPILNFIELINSYENLIVITNPMSTQVFGEFEIVMKAFQESLKKSFLDESKVVVVTKFFNKNLLEKV